MVDITDIQAAASRIAGHVLRTPTVASPGLSELLGVPVTAKLELLQLGGSFKVRGAASKLLTLTDDERAAGVVAVSGGNHAIGVAVMAGALGVSATVVMPRSAPARAASAARAAGADVRLTDDMAGAFALMDQLQRGGMTLLHPFADPVVLAGQGTVGLELAADATDLTDVLVSIGGRGRSGADQAVVGRVHLERPQRLSAHLRPCVHFGHRGAAGVRRRGRAGHA